MIFLQPFCDNFPSHTHIMSSLSLSLLLWFLCQYLFFFVNLWLSKSCHTNGCSNNTPHCTIHQQMKTLDAKGDNYTLNLLIVC